MFKNILVAVDGSEYAWKALESAKKLAEKFGGRLVVTTVVQIYPNVTFAGIMPGTIFAEQEEQLAGQGKLVLEEAKAKLADFEGQVDYVLEKGHPAEKIISLTKSQSLNIDSVVIGSRGLSGIEEFFLGSVSINVAERAQVPVFIVK